MGPWGWETQKSLDTVTIPHDHVIGCNHLQWTGRNSADWELCGAGVGFTGRIHLHWHCLDKVKAAIMAIVKGYSWGLFDCLFLIGYNWTLNNISLSIRSQVTLEISVYNPLSKQFVFCWSSHVLLKNLLLLYVKVCMCVEVRGQLYVISNLFPSLYGPIWRSNSDVHGNGQPRLQVLKERFVNCLYFGNFFYILEEEEKNISGDCLLWLEMRDQEMGIFKMTLDRWCPDTDVEGVSWYWPSSWPPQRHDKLNERLRSVWKHGVTEVDRVRRTLQS